MLDDYEVHISGKHVHVLEEQGRIVAYVVLIPEDDKTAICLIISAFALVFKRKDMVKNSRCLPSGGRKSGATAE